MAGAEKGDEYLFKVLVVGEVCLRPTLFFDAPRKKSVWGEALACVPRRPGGIPIGCLAGAPALLPRRARVCPGCSSCSSLASSSFLTRDMRTRRQVAGGKTSLVRRYVYNNFSENYQTTIGKQEHPRSPLSAVRRIRRAGLAQRRSF